MSKNAVFGVLISILFLLGVMISTLGTATIANSQACPNGQCPPN